MDIIIIIIIMMMEIAGWISGGHPLNNHKLLIRVGQIIMVMIITSANIATNYIPIFKAREMGIISGRIVMMMTIDDVAVVVVSIGIGIRPPGSTKRGGRSGSVMAWDKG